MPLLKTWFSKRYRPAWAALVIVMVLGLSLLSPPVRALAGNFLNLFRVQKIEVVEFDPVAVLGEGGFQSAMSSLETVMDEQVTVSLSGEPQTVDEGTLRGLPSIRVRLPRGIEGEPHYALQPAAAISVQVDLPRIQALLLELGYEDVDLPDSLDGADVAVALNHLVVAAYGMCEPNTEAWAGAHGTSDFDGPCTVLMQMRSPTVSGPAGLDVDQLGQAYLQLLGMSAGEAQRFSEHLDWTATLVLPLPRTEVSYDELMVDGVTGVLIRPTHNRLPEDEYVLMWVKDDIVYGLSGVGSAASAVRIANSLD